MGSDVQFKSYLAQWNNLQGGEFCHSCTNQGSVENITELSLNVCLKYFSELETEDSKTLLKRELKKKGKRQRSSIQSKSIKLRLASPL